ncbi:MAG: MarR family transcriptional regulator [Sneathiella sp.]|jgi:DNA-binding MarR family transcriptional regulator|uniref:MarR family winged helix-turn-helix transcriptional regulator n=1 Tax=Sneathiella sp. TaxID=1964365 RepID=UPI000C642652|nr:MarR family transcriptional regulator [Sneathiella sp.]MAL80374.1 MarR family transcriptional regulator [Sneathiella sp.]|tara:strand:- start:560 stop:1054 length:495 start_codon:yes stop_codon:yes gene_type:complete
MTDLKSANNPLFLREEELRQAIELLFFAYREFTAGPDQILKDYNFGRAHHRVIHFVGRNEGIIVSELLDILRITKQSLNRVLSNLIERGFIEQRQGEEDRRQRCLYLTEKGRKLEQELSRVQRDLVGHAFREAGADAVAGYRKVLLGLIDEDIRDTVLKRVLKP